MCAYKACRLSSAVLFTAIMTTAAGGQTEDAASLEARARAIHDRVIALDTHVDINPANFTPDRNYTQRLGGKVDLVKMEEGGLDAVFLIVYVGQRDDFSPDGYARAYESAIAKFEAIHRLAEDIAPERIQIAYTADDVRRIAASGKKVALIGVENGYSLGDDLGRVKEFYDRGARYLSLAHNGHSQLSDSNSGERDGMWKWNGLSPLGEQVIAELNKWGIMVDISHPSRASIMRTLEISQAPIIASHSSVRAICDHSRNLDDEQLLALKENGGVVQMVALGSYVKCGQDAPERQTAISELRAEFGMTGRGGRGGLGNLTGEQRSAYMNRMAEINEKFPPPPRATVQDFVDHIDYAVKLIGIDHVGISSDFDGGGGIEGWNDASETFNVTLELVRRGYSEEDIAKIWSGNLLRVMDEVAKVAEQLQAGGN